MAKRTFISLLTSFVAGFIGGFLCTGLFTAIYYALFKDNDLDSLALAFSFLGIGVFINGVICFLLCLLIYLPICIFDKKHIAIGSFRDLLTRYTPIVIIPLSIICTGIYLLFQHDTGTEQLMHIFLLSAFSVSYISLIVFTKVIKSAIHESN